MNSPYETLGVDETATADEIKAAYREKAKHLHPDTKNGNAAAFGEVSLAYGVLIDPDKRKRVDAGLDPDARKLQQKALDLAVGVFQGVLQKRMANVEFHDLVSESIQEVANQKIKLAQATEVNTKAKVQVEKAIERLNKKPSEYLAILFSALEKNVIDIGVMETQNKEQAEVVELAIKILREYKYRVDEKPGGSVFVTNVRVTSVGTW